MQRAQDKITAMQARAGAMDELLASGSLTDLTSGHDDIQAQLDKVSSKGQVETELARMKSRAHCAGARRRSRVRRTATSGPSGAPGPGVRPGILTWA